MAWQEQVRERDEDTTPAITVTPRRSWPRWTPVLPLAAVPAVIMIVEALRAPRLHFLDYWWVLDGVSNPDGSLHPSGLVQLYNGHPAALAGALFWLDARLFGGNNQLLGVLNVVLAAAIVAVLYQMLPARMAAATKVALTAAFSFLLFAPGALEIYGFAMTGAHVLLGLLPSVVAIAFAHRGRTVPAVVAGALASLDHGLSLPVWAALVIVAWLRRDRPWQVALPLAIGLAVVSVWFVKLGSGTDGAEGPLNTLGPDVYAAALAGALSPLRVADAATVALAAGAMVAGLILLLGIRAARERLRPYGHPATIESAGWIGLGIQMIAAAAMIAISRADFGPTVGLSTRYALLSALATSAALVLLVLSWRPRQTGLVAALAGAVVLVSYVTGSAAAINVRNQYPGQTLLAVAMRVGADDVVRQLRVDPAVLPSLRAMHAYPFNDDFTLACNGVELGDQVELGATRPLEAGPAQTRTGGFIESGPVAGGTELSGWAVIGNARADCVVVVDQSGTVIGGGYTGLDRADVATNLQTPEWHAGWKAVADPTSRVGIVLVAAGGVFYQVTATASKQTG